jgi:hypothetical protein
MVKKSYKKTMKGSGTGARKRIMTSERTQKMKNNLRQTQNRKQRDKKFRRKGRHPMFSHLPGKANNPKNSKKKEQMKQYEKNVGNRFRLNRPSLRNSAKKCFGNACKRSSRLLKELGKGMYKQSTFMAKKMAGKK